jgi:DNA-binding transcriptional ArsR family regulator
LFVPEKNLKDLVISYVKSEERSISALTRQLNKDGYKFHRLFITGYLKALTDMGLLRERDIPPSKIYTTSAYRGQNLYEAVGEQCRALEKEERRQVRLAIAVLQRLFRRPVFLREIKECGFGTQIDAPQASKEEREEARKMLLKIGIQLPTNEPAYYLKERKDQSKEAVLASVVLQKFEVTGLVQATRQVSLEEKKRY